ncbi:MAG TPA: HDOD domain-containing protein, partial [Aliarcobacter cryaerophilus]|nr:HDOD domain-containing protein [Aliarcobacter cryaerophilus]
TFDDFLYSNTLSMLIVEMWLKKSDKKLKDELLIPAFLQDLAKPFISQAISENKLTEQFLNEIKNSNMSKAEEKFIGFNSQRISSTILKNWGLSHNIIFPILFSKDLKNCPDEFRLKALILNIVSIVSNLREPLLESNIKKAINEIELFELNSDRFLSTISNINDNIKSNS